MRSLAAALRLSSPESRATGDPVRRYRVLAISAESRCPFTHRDVLAIEIGEVPPAVRARTPERLPVVLSREEIGAILKQLAGTMRLVVMLLCATRLFWIVVGRSPNAEGSTYRNGHDPRQLPGRGIEARA